MGVKWGDIRVEDVISPLRGRLSIGGPGLPISGICTDSRQVMKGCIFFALKGERFDGHDFAVNAMEQGASCIVIDNGYRIDAPAGAGAAVIRVDDTLKALGDLASWWRHQFNVKVVGLTGSSGKTTTKEMTAAILGLGARTLKTEGNLNNLIGLPLTIFRMEDGVGRMVLEMGMNRPGEIGRLTEIADPDVGMIINVGRAHLEGLGDMKGVARAKAELLERMSPEGLVILNGDDVLLMEEAARFTGEVMRFGLGPENDVRAYSVRNLGMDGVSFELRYRDMSCLVTIPLLGMHNVLNALAAASVAVAVGEPFEAIPEGLRRYEGMKGRFRSVSLAGDIILVDDTYNSNPSSLKAALESVRGMAAGERRVILGLADMLELGDETVSAHLEAGGMAADTGASWFFAMGDHAGEMRKGAIDRGLSPERVCQVDTHEEMITGIGDVLMPGDIVLLKGSRRMGLDSVARGLEQRCAQGV